MRHLSLSFRPPESELQAPAGCGGLLEPKPCLFAESWEENAGLTRGRRRREVREDIVGEIFTEDARKSISFLVDSGASDSLSLCLSRLRFPQSLA